MARPGIITLDGTVASGKTSVGRLLARELQYGFLDTGIMYRAITWLSLERGINAQDGGALGRLARETVIRLKDQDAAAVLVNGRGLAAELRQPQVDRAVSLVSMVQEVRSALVEQQREIARPGRIVVVGRDIGTVVLPYADLKLFLSASISERARRRYMELTQQGHEVEYDQVLTDMEARDQLDEERAHSPLRPAADAVLLDTDCISVEGVVEKVQRLIRGD